MTWARYNKLWEHWKYEPPIDHLLTVIAVATSHGGWKPPERPKSGEEAVRELMGMFPGGVIRGPQG